MNSFTNRQPGAIHTPNTTEVLFPNLFHHRMAFGPRSDYLQSMRNSIHIPVPIAQHLPSVPSRRYPIDLPHIYPKHFTEGIENSTLPPNGNKHFPVSCKQPGMGQNIPELRRISENGSNSNSLLTAGFLRMGLPMLLPYVTGVPAVQDISVPSIEQTQSPTLPVIRPACVPVTYKDIMSCIDSRTSLLKEMCSNRVSNLSSMDEQRMRSPSVTSNAFLYSSDRNSTSPKYQGKIVNTGQAMVGRPHKSVNSLPLRTVIQTKRLSTSPNTSLTKHKCTRETEKVFVDKTVEEFKESNSVDCSPEVHVRENFDRTSNMQVTQSKMITSLATSSHNGNTNIEDLEVVTVLNGEND